MCTVQPQACATTPSAHPPGKAAALPFERRRPFQGEGARRHRHRLSNGDRSKGRAVAFPTSKGRKLRATSHAHRLKPTLTPPPLRPSKSPHRRSQPVPLTATPPFTHLGQLERERPLLLHLRGARIGSKPARIDSETARVDSEIPRRSAGEERRHIGWKEEVGR